MKRKTKILLIVLLIFVLFFVTINVIPPTKVIDNNPFITNEDDGPMLVAHRGGKVLNPENTIKAMDASVNEFDVDVLEMDLCLTKDLELVIIHNLYINSYCDVEEITNNTDKHYVNNYTLDELLNFNFGYKFVDVNGNTPYKDLLNNVKTEDRKKIIKDNNLNIVRIDDLFNRYYSSNPDLLYIVEIKNDGELGKKAADILNNLLSVKYPNLLHHVVIGTFHTDVSTYLEEVYPNLFIGASIGTAAKFIITQMLGVNTFFNAKFVCLQIPPEYTLKGITLKLTKPNYINRAHKKNIAVQVWTINDEDTMNNLIDLKVDAIMTDNPELLNKVLKDKGYR